MSSNNQKLRHILELSKEEKIKFIDSFDIIFSDCDGVLFLVAESIQNAGKAVNLLKNAGKQFICVSNNSMRTGKQFIEKLNEIGVSDLTENNFVYPAKTIMQYFKKHNFDGPIFTSSHPVVNKTLSDAGYEILNSSHQDFNDLNSFIEYIEMHTKKLAKAVIIDFDINLTYSKLVLAQYYLHQPDCMLLVGASDLLIPLYKDFNVIGPNKFIQYLQQATDKEPIFLGKPGKLLEEYLIENYNIQNKQRVLFIGDALSQDIGFGNSCNFQTLCVLTGATTKQILFSHKNENELPNFYADSLSDFIQFFNDL